MIEGRWMPQTEEEWQMLEDLHVVTRVAAEDGVSKARIASLLAFMSSAVAQQAAFEDRAQSRPQAPRESGESEAASPPGEGPKCPECGDFIEDFVGSFGTPRCPHCEEPIVDDDIIDQVMQDE